jgi:hypothetical protein
LLNRAARVAQLPKEITYHAITFRHFIQKL